ncbi:ankyrin repeat-containing protein [Aspergillus eucalypticola CBS 122712]|uniref:Ankyrin repeat-containing protein n=1 Tax=Aspergillus eucalypticola (strain CBS 122712 / IBT 29274) TaxID=1448314 RepID=A0A317W474_ASPEC|nr:ankyrin repeat-containing protein [Aspergillus eucalypticola CBS 122712]PWY78970.1 ankyrin repeat-containing protein [Aspergillus eucalypticola CBS 122712]
MRFGRNIYLHQVPEWAEHHVPYNRLKRLLKIAVEKATEEQTRPDFSGHLRFRIEQESYLRKQAEEIQGHYRISLCKFDTTTAYKLSRLDIEILCQSLSRLTKEISQLQRYQRLDVEAVSRIHTKIDKYMGREINRSAGRNDLDKFKEQNPSRKALARNLGLWIAHLQEALSDPSSRPVYPQSPLYEALRQDQPSIVVSMVDKSLQQSESSAKPFLFHLLELAVYELRPHTVYTLLFDALPQNDIPIQAALLNRLFTVLSFRKMQLSAPYSCILFCKIRDLLCQVIGELGPRSEEVLLSEDTLGRFPLHYAASYGLLWECVAIFNVAKSWNNYSKWCLIMHTDKLDCSPFEYAAVGNHRDAVSSVLVYLEKVLHASDKDDGIAPLFTRTLFTALHYEYEDMISVISQACSRFCRTPRNCEGASPLHVAARTGRADRVKQLLETVCVSELNSVEPIYGWTPLVVACVEGHQSVVAVLLEHGADRDIKDHRGWTAQEHAAFRGHLALAKGMTGPSKWESDTDVLTAASMVQQDDNVKALHQRPQLVVYLGSLQDGKQVNPFECRTPSLKTKATGNDLALKVSSPGNDSARQINMSFLGDTANESFIFELPTTGEAELRLELLDLGDGRDGQAELLGGGTALLIDNLNSFGENRESLVRERSIPILESRSFQAIATVTFTFLIIKPFQHPNIPSVRECFLRHDDFCLVGHRGFGQNVAGHDYLQLGENTVEFDAQLTRDLVPVAYHDFSLMHDVTLDQFLHASKIQSPMGHPTSIMGSRHHHKISRSRSLTRGYEQGAQQMQERMRHTVDYMSKGFKPNTRGHVIQDSFATIEELLTLLPENLGFNVEISESSPYLISEDIADNDIEYPRPHEATEAGVAPVAIEINIFVDKILEKVFTLGNSRNIILSSFTPEIFILLALKQQTYPVMYITNAGKPPVTDREKRAGSLQAAVRFAQQWGLNGIVLASETLIICPRLIGYVQRSGLVCGSYGPLNNIPENAQLQVDAGINILMADRVGLIAKALEDRDGDDRRLKN